MKKVFLFLFILILLSISPSWASIDINAIVQIESGGNTFARNAKSGCIGLAQINPKGAMAHYNEVHGTSIQPIDLYDPVVNLAIANWYLEWLSEYTGGETEDVLIAYNFGPGSWRNWKKQGGRIDKLPKETQNYIRKYRKAVAK